MGILEGRIAVITGGSRGFGLAIAQAYAEAGASVVVASRSEDSVEAAVESIRAAGGIASGLACDVSELDQVRALARHALDTYGDFNVWVNNAGIAGPYGPTAHLPPDRFVAVVQTNILGTYHGSWVALHHFLPRGEGKLINILGRGDRRPTPMQNAYASSKAWVRSFTLALADEYKDSGVGVFALNPGMMTTDLLTRLEVVEGFEGRLSVMGTIVRTWAKPPEEPAEKAVWLASAATNGKTGLIEREGGVFTLIGGALGEAWRRITGRAGPPPEIKVDVVPSALRDELTNE